MGANVSSPPRGSLGTGLDDLPESCVARILYFLEPTEIAALARVNRAFRDASSADFIWAPKLPSSYKYILANLPDPAIGESRKRDIFVGLSRRRAFDDGTKEVWIDKRTGGVCLAISSKGMNITGINDRRYWNQIQTQESRFGTVAYLNQIWWVEVDGELEFQFPRGTYSLFFRLSLGKPDRRTWHHRRNSENIHGWDVKPVHLSFKTKDGQSASSRLKLDNVGSWVNYHVGNFAVEDQNSPLSIKFSLTQIDCTHTKGGLCVDSVLILPANLPDKQLATK